MNNIEKFDKIKELNQLKCDYHKRELVALISFEKGTDSLPATIGNLINTGKTSFTLFQQIKSLFKN